MLQRHPFPGRRIRRLVLMLAWLLAGPAFADQHTPPAPDAEKQAFEKIVEARGQARGKRYAEALKQLDEAVALAEGVEDKLPLALALHNIAEVQLLKGEPRGCVEGLPPGPGNLYRVGIRGRGRHGAKTHRHALTASQQTPETKVSGGGKRLPGRRRRAALGHRPGGGTSPAAQAGPRPGRAGGGRAGGPSGSPVPSLSPRKTPGSGPTSNPSGRRSGAIRDIPTMPGERARRGASIWPSRSGGTARSKTWSC